VIASLMLVAALAATPDGPGFRIALRGAPGSTVTMRVQVPHGWLAAFCSSQVCAIGRVTVRIPATGVASVELHVHDVPSGAHGRAIVEASGQSLTLAF
jgi:hypothetical protein